MMSAQSLKTKISEEETVFTLKGTKLFRKPLKQIGNSISDLKTFYVKKGAVNVMPRNLDTTLSDIKDDILNRLNDDTFSGKYFDIFKSEIIPMDHKESDALVLICSSLAMAFGMQKIKRPENSICDVLIVKSNCPVLLLSVVNEHDSPVQQNISLARSTTNALRRFINEDFHLVSGTVKQSDLKDKDTFKGIIEPILSSICTLVTTQSLLVKDAKYDKVLMAIFASICETHVVFDSDKNCEYLHFLAMNQGKIFIENLNSPYVNLTSTPQSGSTTLMFEVARRLSTLGKTLLICRTKEEKEKFSYIHPETVCRAELPTEDLAEYLSLYINIVDETNTVQSPVSGRLWSFTKVLDDDIMEQGKIEYESEWKESVDDCDGQPILKHDKEDTDALKGFNVVPTESDKDVQIKALNEQIQALRGKLYGAVKRETKVEPRPDSKAWQYQDSPGIMRHREEKYADVKPLMNITAERGVYLKPEPVDVSSQVEGVVKQEPIDIPSGEPTYIYDDSQEIPSTSKYDNIIDDSSESDSTNTDVEFSCPLCPFSCTSEAEIKQHFNAKHPISLPYAQAEIVAGPSRHPDSPSASPGPSHRPDSPSASPGPSHRPVSTNPFGMKRVKITYLECPFCPKRFKTERGCKKHMTSIHPESGDPFYLVGSADSPRPVSCPPMTLDSDRVNSDKCQVTENGELGNSPRPGERLSGGFRIYKGTCSRLPIPLPSSPSTVTTPRYWETQTRVRVVRQVSGWWDLLEMGVSQEGEVDTWDWVSNQSHSWAVHVGECLHHSPGICTHVSGGEWRQVGDCRRDTVSTTPGTTVVLHYGVVLDIGTGTVAFIDLDREIVLHRFHVKFTEPLRPMFGVGSSPSDCTVDMKLVSGEDIKMTDTKKDLISQALTTT